jgi:Na+-translocating ferredoxin:NAD+ oxidoreductase RnfG subunit
MFFRQRLLIVCALLLSGGFFFSSEAKTLLSMEEALRKVFPDAELKRSSTVLTDEEKAAVEKRAGTKLRSALVYPYEAFVDGKLVGTAYFDVHRVRTLSEALMVAVNLEGKVVRVEVLSFKEPQEYLPSARWYAQFDGKALDGKLQLKRDIRVLTGATLSSRATTDAVRRVLALHAELATPSP